MNKPIFKIRELLKPLNNCDKEYPDQVIDYFKFYGLDVDDNDIEHIFGTFESGKDTLAAHIYRPEKYKAAVVAVHGYFDHCGQLNHLIKYLLKAGYAVAAFDLPGLGLSTGKRGEVEDFSQYSQALMDFADTLKPLLNAPYHFIGHSTGSTAILDSLLTNKDNVFDRVILTAPLVHCTGWEQSKISYNEKIQFVKSVPRIFRKSSSDAKFLKFVKHKDPLQTKTIPLIWVRALHKWNDKIADSPTCEKPIKIIQGTNDATIDWQYNIEFLLEKFSNAEVSMIENARHELFNESTDIRANVFSQIISYFNAK